MVCVGGVVPCTGGSVHCCTGVVGGLCKGFSLLLGVLVALTEGVGLGIVSSDVTGPVVFGELAGEEDCGLPGMGHFSSWDAAFVDIVAFVCDLPSLEMLSAGALDD